MNRKVNKLQSVQALRALAVIIVMLLTSATTWAEDYLTGVDYMTWSDSEKKLVKKNTATDDNDANDKVWILTGGTATTLPGGWYVVMNKNTDAAVNNGIDAAYTGTLEFTGATHLILADDAEMTVDNQGDGYAIVVNNNDAATLDIYGQAHSSGALTATSASSVAIFIFSDNSGTPASLTINGGKVSATPGTNDNGFYVRATGTGEASVTVNGGEVAASGNTAINTFSNNGNVSVTINGGEVKANGDQEGIKVWSANGTATATITSGKVTAKGGNYGIRALTNEGSNSSAITITGGEVEATGNTYGIFNKNGDITLSLNSNGEYIKANSYSASGSVKIPAGKALACTIGEATTVMGSTDATDYIFDASGNTTLEHIAGQTLVLAVPFEIDNPYVVKTFDGNWKVAGGAKTFLPAGYDLSAGQVTLAEVNGAPGGQPVIVGLEEGQNLPATCFLVPAQGDEVKDDYDDVVGNMSKRFVITDGEMTLSKAIEQTGVSASEAVILVLTNGKFTTVAFSDTDLDKLTKPGLLLFVLSKWEYMQIKPNQSAAAPIGARTIGIGDGNTTGITTTNFTNYTNEAGAWYDLQGRKLSKPTKKGIYIFNGKKVIK